jgi:dihydrofolate synthase / folylpolyglutamate synthase
VPVVTAEVEGTPAAIFRRVAAEAGAPLRAVTADQLGAVDVGLDGTTVTVGGTAWGELRLHTPLAGRHQATNVALAAHALDLAHALRPDARHVVEGIARVRWAGRLQLERLGGVTWLFDVAHNVAGVEALAAALSELPLSRPVIALVGVLGDKDWANMLRPLQQVVDHVILTEPPTAPVDRRWNPEEALAAAPSENSVIERDFTAALERVHDQAAVSGGSVLVTGSFHTVGDALAALSLCADGSDITVAQPAFAHRK